ncbi:unnamed protein product, partial [Urochloa humidicola]
VLYVATSEQSKKRRHTCPSRRPSHLGPPSQADKPALAPRPRPGSPSSSPPARADPGQAARALLMSTSSHWDFLPEDLHHHEDELQPVTSKALFT